MKKIVFCIHTEYHLMFGLKMICCQYDLSNDDIYIYRISPFDTNRLNQKFDFEGTNINYREIRYYDQRYKDCRLKEELSLIVEINPDEFVLFNEEKKWLAFLLPNLKKNDCKIILAPDGINVYYTYRNLKVRLSNLYHGNFYLLSNGFRCFMKMPEKYYGYRKCIDEIIVEDKNAFVNHSHKKVIELKVYPEIRQKIAQLTNRIFKYDLIQNGIENGSFLWLDQPLEEVVNEKYLFLKELHDRYPNKKIYVKPHPYSYQEEIEKYEKDFGTITVNTPFPAELVIENLENVSIISVCTTAMLYYNPTCYYYWIYPMFKGKIHFNPKKIPFDYIRSIKDISEICMTE